MIEKFNTTLLKEMGASLNKKETITKKVLG
jgi:hypothetical protein